MMNKDVINDLVLIVKTLSNQEIKNYIEKYSEFLFEDTYLELVSSMKGDELQKKYLDCLDQNLVIKIIDCWRGNCPNRKIEFIIRDCFNSFLEMIGSICDSRLQEKYLENIMNEIIPLFKRILKNDDLFYFCCEEDYIFRLKRIIENWDDELRERLLLNVSYQGWSRDRISLYEMMDDDQVRMDLIDSGKLVGGYNTCLYSSFKSKDLLKYYLVRQVDMLDEFVLGKAFSLQDMDVVIINFIKTLDLIRDDNITKRMIDYYQDYLGFDFLASLISIIKSDSLKDYYLVQYEVKLVYFVDCLINILVSIKDEEIYQKYYEKYKEKFSCYHKLQIASRRKDSILAKELIFEQYTLLNNSFLEYNKRIEVMSNLTQLFSFLDKDLQLEMFSFIKIVLKEKEEVVLVSYLNDEEFKKSYVNEILKKFKTKELKNNFLIDIIH